MIINTKFIIFKINDMQSLIIKNLCYEGDHLYRWDPVDIVFKDGDSEYIICQHDHLMPVVEDIYYYLLEAIEGKLLLLESIVEDIGYLRNQYFHYSSLDSHEQHEDKEDWNVPVYTMWGGNKFETWLYNKNNKIYLEIMPIYPWHFSDRTDEENFIPYDEWIKSYKPLAIIEIDKTTAQQWFDQAGELMQEIEKSDEKYLHVPQKEPGS